MIHTRFKSTKLPFTRICKLLIRPISYVKFVLIRVASNWCSVQLRPYSSLFVPNRLPGHRNECEFLEIFDCKNCKNTLVSFVCFYTEAGNNIELHPNRL